MKFFIEKENATCTQPIDGFKVLKGLLKATESPMVNYSEIPLTILENTALRIYNLEATAANRLFVTLELIKFYKYRSLLKGTSVRVTRTLWGHISHY